MTINYINQTYLNVKLLSFQWEVKKKKQYRTIFSAWTITTEVCFLKWEQVPKYKLNCFNERGTITTMQMRYESRGYPRGGDERGEHMLCTYGCWSVSPKVLGATGQDVVSEGC